MPISQLSWLSQLDSQHFIGRKGLYEPLIDSPTYEMSTGTFAWNKCDISIRDICYGIIDYAINIYVNVWDLKCTYNEQIFLSKYGGTSPCLNV